MNKKFKTKLKGLGSRMKKMGAGAKVAALSLCLSVLTPALTFAQNAAGDYTAGTNALTTVTEEIAKYVPIVVKLCYAIAGVVAIVGAISVYIAMNNEEQDVKNILALQNGQYSICNEMSLKSLNIKNENKFLAFQINSG